MIKYYHLNNSIFVFRCGKGGGTLININLKLFPQVYNVFFRKFFMIVLHPVLLQVSKMWNNEIGAQYIRKQNNCKNRQSLI